MCGSQQRSIVPSSVFLKEEGEWGGGMGRTILAMPRFCAERLLPAPPPHSPLNETSPLRVLRRRFARGSARGAGGARGRGEGARRRTESHPAAEFSAGASDGDRRPERHSRAESTDAAAGGRGRRRGGGAAAGRRGGVAHLRARAAGDGSDAVRRA